MQTTREVVKNSIHVVKKKIIIMQQRGDINVHRNLLNRKDASQVLLKVLLQTCTVLSYVQNKNQIHFVITFMFSLFCVVLG